MLFRSVVTVVALAALALNGSLADRLTRLSRNSVWTLEGAVLLEFRTYHPQGMVKIGDTFFVSSVDKDGRAGHLFKIDNSGRLLTDLLLGEGAMYHPGGIDFDGRDIWVPVAEYRPDSRSIIYRVDPATMKANEVFRVADHIGAIVHNTDDRTLHGVSWGSRRFYRWTIDGRARGIALNPSHYIDYQDCKYIGGGNMLCGGVAELRGGPNGPAVRLGGLDIVSLKDGRPVFLLPVALRTAAGMSLTQNPIWIEAAGQGLRAYFLPEDDRSTLYVYDVR